MKKKKFAAEPFHSYVIVKPFPSDYISTGGILIPDSHKERMNKAWVMAVGQDLKDKKNDDGEPLFDEGYVVIHVKGAGTPMEVDGQEYFIMRHTDILTRVKDEETKVIEDKKLDVIEFSEAFK